MLIKIIKVTLLFKKQFNYQYYNCYNIDRYVKNYRSIIITSIVKNNYAFDFDQS